MKINTKKRITAASSYKPMDANLAYDLFLHNLDEDAEELIQKYSVDPKSFLDFVHKNNCLEKLIQWWINDVDGFTGNLAYDLEYYMGDPNDNKPQDPVGFINYLTELVNLKSVYATLKKEYLNLAKSKYRKYVYPVMDTYYYSQVFPEFKDFDPDEYDIDFSSYTELEDYVKSTGFR